MNCIEGNPLLAVLGFLESLTNHYDDGRIVCSRAKTIRESYIKFLLLNPATHFTDVVKEARYVALVVCGSFQFMTSSLQGSDTSRWDHAADIGIHGSVISHGWRDCRQN